MGNTKRVHGAWDVSFHKIVDKARQDYSKQLKRKVSITEVTKIWGENKLAKFKVPPLRFRREYEGL